MLIRYACLKCRYDVTRTLMDDIVVCPECGSTISEAICKAPLPSIWKTMGAGKAVVLVFAALAGAFAFNIAFLNGFMPKSGGVYLLGVIVSNDIVGFAQIGIVILACELVCYLVWWLAERTRNRTGAAMRALGRTVVVVVVQVLLMGSCAWMLALGTSV